MAEESAVKVCVRVRPLIEREETAGENTDPVSVHWKADKQTIHQIDDGNLTKTFAFDRVFSADETTLQLYQELAKPLVVSAVEGYNGTIFAYGQTSSGKTFTMMGSSLTPGVIPLAMADVFQTIKNCPKKEFLLRVSYLEIYNETVTDLLCDSWKRKPLEIKEGNNKNVYVADLTEELVTSPEQALAWLKKGEKNRHYGKTKMNQRSSRSHTIFRMILESRDRGDPASGENSDGAIIVSHLNLVDLAGAERASQTGAEGTRFKEGCNINRSLFTLGQVIKKLSDETQKGFTNYRDSKLTRILQNSLGGNAKTVIICTITPVTVEETLSTLQFASAAKNMKNDPHVTEVSDDGALLRRYRNEIADLKRRLHEVSSVTQTTATEKETLSQILQEKDQLQREQEDRIRNLTKLLVTSSNFVPIKTMPKRRVTWGGKLPSPAFHHVGETDLCISESFMKKRKNDMSVLTEQNEDSEEFDFTFDGDMNQSSVPCAESEFLSRNQLEIQLENETQRKLEAMEKVETLQSRLAELEKELETKSQVSDDTQEQMKKGLEETIQLCETLVIEKEMIAAEQECLKHELNILMEQTDHLKKEKAALLLEMEEKKEMDEFNSLEEEIKKEYEVEMLNEMSSLTKAMETSERKCQELQANMVAMSEELKKKSEWAEELQRMSDVDLVQQVKQLRRSLDDAEGLSRDTKKDWAHLRSENISLKERDVTLTAGYERVESEMKSLCRQLEAEKSHFKTMQTDLQRELQDAFKENTKLTALLDGKVPKNLIESIELERTVACLKKQLEKCREDERAVRLKVEELIALQDLPEKVESLTKQLKESEECRSLNENKLSGMQHGINDLEEKLGDSETAKKQSDRQVLELQDQIRRLNQELESVRAERMSLVSEKTNDRENHAEEFEKLLSTVTSLTEERNQLQQIMEGLKEEKNQLKRDLEENVEMQQLDSEKQPQNEHPENDLHLQMQLGVVDDLKEQLEALKEENSQLKTDLQDNVEMMIENQEELREAQKEIRSLQERNQLLKTQKAETETQLNTTNDPESASGVTELKQQMKLMNEEFESVRAERDCLLSKETLSTENQTGQLEKLLSSVTSLTEERDQLQEILEGVKEERNQLRRDLEENVERIQQLREDLEGVTKEICQLKSDLKEKVELAKNLSEELESVQAERMSLMSEKTPNTEKHAEELEKLLSTVTSLTEERNQLQQIMEDLKEEKNQLKRDLEENVEMMILVQEELKQQQQAERIHILSEETPESNAEDFEKLFATVTSLTEERDQIQQKLETVEEERNQLNRALQENVEKALDAQKHLHSIQEELLLQTQLNSEIKAQSLQKETLLEQQAKHLSEELESVRAERMNLLSEKTPNTEKHAEELEKLLSTVTSLTEERNQLQQIMEGLKEEKNQLKRDLEENVEMMILVQGELKQQQHLHSEHQAQSERQEATLQQKALDAQKHLHSIQDELLLQTQLNSEIKAQSLQKETLLEQQVKHLSEELESVRAERINLLSEKTPNTEKHAEELEKLLSTVTSLTEERNQLQQIMEGLKEEKNQLKRDLEENVEMMILVQEELKQQQYLHSEHQAESECQEATLQEKIQQLGEELETMTKDGCRLKSDLKEKVDMAKHLSEELESVRAERMSLLSEKTPNTEKHAEELEKLLSTVTSLTEERNQLQQIMEGLKEEKNQLKRDLEENVEMMILVQEELKQQQHLHSEHQAESECQEATLQQKIQQLGEELETMTKVRCQLKSELKEKVEMADTHAENLEKLLSSVTSLTEERDQLQQIMEGVKEEKNQLKGDLEENVERTKQLSEELESVRAERKHLMSENAASLQKHAVELEKLLSTVTLLNEERDQLQLTLEEIQGERIQLKNDQVENVKVASFVRFQLISDSSKQEHGPMDDVAQVEKGMILKLLPLVSEVTRKTFSNVNRYTIQTTNAMWDIKVLLKLWAKECKTHFEALVQNDLSVYEEKRLQDLLLCRAPASSHSVKMAENDLLVVWDQRLLELQMRRGEHLEKMNSVLEKLEERLALHPARVSSELRERAKRNEELSALCMVSSPDSAAVERFLERELVRCSSLAQATTLDLQGLRDEYRDLLKEQCSVRSQSDSQLKEERSKRCSLLQKLENAPVNTNAILLCENQQHILQHQQLEGKTKTNNLIKSLTCGTTRTTDGLCLTLKASSEQIQESFVRFQLVIRDSSKQEPGPMDEVEQVEQVMILKLLPLVSEVTKKTFSNVNRYTIQTTNAMWDIKVLLKLWAKKCKTHFEALVQNDLSVYEEKRFQDLLLCRAQASSHSVKMAENDLLVVWDQRLLELQMRRGEHLEKMNSVLEKLEERLALHPARVSSELRERAKRNEELSALCMVSSPDSAAVARFLDRELVRCSSLAQATTLDLQGLRDEYRDLLKEQCSVRSQSDNQLKEERSKRCSLLQKLETAPVNTDAILLWENQQLFPQRQQLVGEIKALAERRTSTTASEVEELKTKVVKLELEKTAMSSKLKEELLKMTTILNHKEDALRTLKETLRRSQQAGEQSFMEGEDLHARLRNTSGRTVQSNIVTEKNKLEEEVKRLQKRFSELESLASAQQGELNKWKARAIKLKKRDVVDKPLSPSTPTKRFLPINSEDFLNSPKKLLESPKSKFFDVRPGSESMPVNRPKQFFDNSTFVSSQDMEAVGRAEEDADKEDWCPLSPKQQDLCKQQ